MTNEESRSRIAGLAVLLIFAGIALPAILRHALFTENWDETRYHLPAIAQFAAQLPHPDFAAYSSATTPLYHLIFALLMRMGCGLTALRLINFAVSLATVVLVMMYLRGASDERAGQLPYSATLLFASSLYVMGP